MENLSLFDFDYLQPRVSKCETNHFHIVLDSDLRWPFCLNDNKTRGLFMHEYIHYVQHLSTLCGISLSMHYNKLFVEYRIYFEEHNTIKLPLILGDTTPQLKRFFEYFNMIKGSRVYHNRLDDLDCNPELIEKAKEERKAVSLTAYNEERQEWDIINHINLGYYAIVESMADMIQRIYDPDVEHDTIPYLAVQKVCEKIYPEISRDYRMMVSICICALMYSNPGVGLFEAINYAKNNPGINGYFLYNHFIKENSLCLPSGEEITIHDMFVKQLTEYKKTIDIVFGGHIGYYGKAIDNAMIGATSGNNALLALLYDDSIPASEYICHLADFYGYPYIEAKDLTLWPGEEKRAIDVAVAVGFELLYKRFTNKISTECPRAEMCKSYGKYTYECKYDQWNHIEPCPFTSAVHVFNLKGKTFEQEMFDIKMK